MASLLQRTQNLSVRKKLLSGFSLVLLILVMISVLSYNGLESQTARFKLVTDVSEANLLISEARQQEKNYMLRNERHYYQQALELAANAYTLGQQSLTQMTTEEAKAFMQQMLQHLTVYQQHLAQLGSATLGSDEALRIEALMTVAARAADQAATESVALQLARLEQETTRIERVITLAAIIALFIGLGAALIITSMVVTPLHHVIGVAEKIAAGDLTNNLPTTRQDEPGQLMRAMQQMTLSLRDVLQSLTLGIAQLASATEEMAAISEQNSAGVRQQKEETEQVATAMNEMAATVQDVAKSAEEASDAANQSAEQAVAGEQVVQQTVLQIKTLAHEVAVSAQAINELSQQSSNIGEVLDVIKSIADQTNLLALNAAIEAARAGDAGRGFSVVADEVRALAFRTQESTGKIEQLIGSLQQKAEASVTNMQKSATLVESTLDKADNVGSAIKVINEAVVNIQQMNHQIAAAALQQSTVAEQINRSIFNIRDVAEQSATASEQTAAASSDLSVLGNELQQLAARFKVA
ncbi:hypothetical protein GCM10010919_24140 [Alishewanella longhuensis]|uniref:Methyl-accepting chemotaxis protein n=1 Tax=Alishewanella longhuensis TaxID=1091037 RepID=A0ABQ3KZY8_9ALTE|nr:methyl-accepting chemotaxis protein [Alishewanella longhuensis]GHG72135.1 hypothetical protein GCM10010919_24140 [Alishewanella longhuensis]